MPHTETSHEHVEAAAAFVEVSGAAPHMLVAFRRILSLPADVQSTLLAFLHLVGDPSRVEGRLDVGDHGGGRAARADDAERITLVLTGAGPLGEAAH